MRISKHPVTDDEYAYRRTRTYPRFGRYAWHLWLPPLLFFGIVAVFAPASEDG